MIGTCCEQCGSQAQPLVLHHLQQPRRFADIAYEIRGDLIHTLMRERPLEPNSDDELVERQACPMCQSVNITWQKTLSRWRCNHPRCGGTFQEPTTVRALTPEVRQARKARGREAYQQTIQRILDAHSEEIMRGATMLSLEEHIHYLRCEDTVTFCKKCAFLWDRKDMRLCSRCRTQCHRRGLEMCDSCRSGPDMYKLCERCGENRHHVRYAVYYSCKSGEFASRAEAE